MASGQFPSSVPDWNNLDVLHKNTLPPRSSFFTYRSEQEALSRDVAKSNSLCISGQWKFKLVTNPFAAPENFEKIEFDVSSWNDITVPGMWQLQGHGKGPQYTSEPNPFPVDPPNVPLDKNETGLYVTTFEVPEAFRGQQLRLRFEGVDSSYHVYINGNEVGYSQGSRNAAEFNISPFIDESRPNKLAVKVYQWCDGSYLEDQDQWWLSGIFRDVFVLAFPAIHIEDFRVETRLDDDFVDAILSVTVNLSKAAKVDLKLSDAIGQSVASESLEASELVKFNIPVQSPDKWTAETPYLYNLSLAVDGYFVSQRVGFRRAEIKNGSFIVNGKPVLFRGVNRHEHHPESGRTVPLEFLKQDLLLMKKYNINSIRTSHQPADYRLYDLADELGFWIIDEADLECHEFFPVEMARLSDYEKKNLTFLEMVAETYPKAAKWITDSPSWEAAYVDRARQMVTRDKNHPSIIMWSMGNESFYGCNHHAIYEWIKSYDPTRVVHYEGDQTGKSVDIFSKMYSSIEEISEFATKDGPTWEKPLILCEFLHAMGNGPGNIKEYMDVFYEYPRLQGGFIWEWANHGLQAFNAAGEKYYGMGGDFGDVPNSYNFCLDGLTDSEHQPTPGLVELRKGFAPIQMVEDTSEEVKVINRYDFLTLDHLSCSWSVAGEHGEQPGGEVNIPKGIKPGQTATIPLPQLSEKEIGHLGAAYLKISFSLRESTLWAEKGHEIAWGQVKLPTQSVPRTSSSVTSPKLTQISPTQLLISNSVSDWTFDLVLGTISSWTKAAAGGRVELLSDPPRLGLYRPLTNNDASSDGIEWKDANLHLASSYIRSVKWAADDKSVVVVAEARIAPPVLEWSVGTTTTYTFTGSLKIETSGKPQGVTLPKTFGRIGLTLAMPKTFNKVRWFGRGPGESYNDKKESQPFGCWTASGDSDELFTNYEFPQESGNRTDISWVEFFSGADQLAPGLRASFGEQTGRSFTALHYSAEDLDAAQHAYELKGKRREELIVRLDWRHHGLGTGSCGPKTLEQYALHSEPFTFELLLE